MEILLTGGAGYIGSHTALSLMEAGMDVVIADDFRNSDSSIPYRIEEITGKRPAVYKMDVSDAQALERLFSERRIGGVIHLAGYKSVNESVKEPLSYYRNNLNVTFALLEVMRRHQCNYLVFSSSAAVYGARHPSPLTEDTPVGDCQSPYAYSKVMNERVLADEAYANPALSVVSLRYFNPVGAHPSGLIGEKPTKALGNLMPHIVGVASKRAQALRVYGNDYPTPDGTCIRDYIHIMDIAEGHVFALKYGMEHTGAEIFNLGRGQGISVLELVNAFQETNGVSVPYVIAERREGDIPICYANADKSFRMLGWKAKRGIEEMCRDAWRWEQALKSEDNR